ncbi:MAG: alpha/beta hydrolase [Candidatus Schekmanbacteria bacterium]|nr:alpha/beta hydrolase [Candidatus Schekmanbacteria bacterium]
MSDEQRPHQARRGARWPRLVPRNRREWLFALFRLAVLLALFSVVMTMLAHRLLHYPDQYSLAELERMISRTSLAAWPSPADPRGLLVAPSGPLPPAGTVAIFHGNAGSAADRTYYAQALLPLGFRVVLLEYPGYGARLGGLGEDELYRDAVESLQAIRTTWGRPLVVLGESLGAAVAAGAVFRLSGQVDGVVLITPWDDLPTVAQSIYWFLPARWLVPERYDSVAHLRAFPGPLAVVVAGRDEIIPKACSERLFRTYSGRGRIIHIDGAGHNTWYDQTDRGWWRELMSFVTSAP